MQTDSQYSRKGYLHEDFRLFHLRDNEGQELDYHFHEFDKIVFLVSGIVTYMVEDAGCAMEPWDFVLVRHHTIHRAQIDRSAPYERIIIYLDPHYIERSAPEGGLLGCFDECARERRFLIRPRKEEREKIKAVLSELEGLLPDEQFGAAVLQKAKLIELMVQLNRAVSHGGGVREVSAPVDAKIASTLSYINENLSGELSVERLAERIYMSKYHFMRLFKAQTGFTVHGYVRQKRLVRAAQLIREGVPASKAADECGFNDYSAFHRAFRAVFNISPAELKK